MLHRENSNMPLKRAQFYTWLGSNYFCNISLIIHTLVHNILSHEELLCSTAVTVRLKIATLYIEHLRWFDSLIFSCCRWSSGVIMYTLLAGSPPFWHRKQMLMLRMILAGNYDFSSPEWEDRSDTVKDLVIRLFNLVNIETIIIF